MQGSNPPNYRRSSSVSALSIRKSVPGSPSVTYPQGSLSMFSDYSYISRSTTRPAHIAGLPPNHPANSSSLGDRTGQSVGTRERDSTPGLGGKGKTLRTLKVRVLILNTGSLVFDCACLCACVCVCVVWCVCARCAHLYVCTCMCACVQRILTCIKQPLLFAHAPMCEEGCTDCTRLCMQTLKLIQGKFEDFLVSNSDIAKMLQSKDMCIDPKNRKMY